MSWRNQLQPASFRGAAFYVQNHQSQVAGRRVALHEFPGADTPHAEDLGPSSNSYRLRAYVVGHEYMAARDKLINACNQAGAAQLVHPYLGEVQALCQSCAVNESSSDGGVAWFDLEFVRYHYESGLASAADLSAAAEDMALAAEEQAGQWYDDLYDLKDNLQSLSDAARSKVLAVASALRKVNSYVDQVGAMSSTLLRSITELEDQIDALIAQPAALAGTFGALFSELGGLLEQVFGASTVGSVAGSVDGANPIPAAAALEPLLRFNEDTDSDSANNARGRADANLLNEEPLPEPDALAEELPVAEQEAINNRVIEASVRLLALAQMPRAFASLNYLPPAALDEYQELCSAALEDMLAVADSNSLPLVRELQDLQLGQLTELRDGASFRELMPLTDMPALVLAHREYGDIDRADEIVALNGLAHPGFCPGGEALVLRA